MSDLKGEDTISMPPLRMSTIESLGEAFLSEFCPNALVQPMAVDVFHLAEAVLPQRGIHVTPAHVVELGNNFALTDPSGSTSIEILLRDDLWDNLIEGGPRANLARATLAHEFGHALLHVPVIRRRRNLPTAKHLLARVARSEVPPYMDAEWQAWALGGCILAPRRTINMVAHLSIKEMAGIYQVSEKMMFWHLKRLKLVR
ncbi:ImmA/IrrE family metallo-endopeptidase [Hyalangium versicolor]|uniref:ImmA/IrrE family metallo-endopeptidase n=1 Tax=Hyalangium versicolor TaxID=2861190 RepID=UPI001CCB34EC|nr:hypothetical protein [Hyalangium versicolor]